MRKSRTILLIVVGLIALAHRSDGQQARPVAEQLRLAALMPRGAMLYVQAANLGSLMKTWLQSGVRDRFYKSPSFDAFSRSRIYLKLQSRKSDFEKAIGFGLDEARLAELAGGASAVAVYDIGKLELVFTSELPRERAIATVLFKQVPQFQERTSEGGPYYVRDVATDGGRLNQQFCFAYSSGKLIVTTTEGLMIRALRNAKAAGSDSLLADVMNTAEQARGFVSHEITMWADQTRLNRNRHFNNYWIHPNALEAASPLGAIATGLIDLRITAEGLSEQRWFVLASASQRQPHALSQEQANAIARFAPPSVQLLEIHAQAEAAGRLSETASQTLFGKLPDRVGEPPAAPDHTRSTDSESSDGARTERYSRLDARFDKDIDDPHALGKAPSGESAPNQIQPARSSFAEKIAPILASGAPAAFGQMARSVAEAGKPFVRFERALIIEMNTAALDRAALERVITGEMHERFVVTGVESTLAWQDEAEVRYLAQSLLEQGAAYSIAGKYLVLASSKEFVRDILRASSSAAASGARIEGDAEFYALVRIADAKPVFDLLMSKLDRRGEEPVDDEEEGEREVKFFSENISSLIGASAVREMRVRRETGPAVMTERVFYAW